MSFIIVQFQVDSEVHFKVVHPYTKNANSQGGGGGGTDLERGYGYVPPS